jgi:hypothetical protein
MYLSSDQGVFPFPPAEHPACQVRFSMRGESREKKNHD